MPIVLLFTTGEKVAELVLLQASTIGRSSQCDLPIQDKEMSSKHGSFECDKKGRLFYTDLGSSNGSYLNNNKIEKTQFKINDSLRIGGTLVTIDAKKLTLHERTTIGVSEVSQKNDNHLSLPTYKHKNKA